MLKSKNWSCHSSQWLCVLLGGKLTTTQLTKDNGCQFIVFRIKKNLDGVYYFVHDVLLCVCDQSSWNFQCGSHLFHCLLVVVMFDYYIAYIWPIVITEVKGNELEHNHWYVFWKWKCWMIYGLIVFYVVFFMSLLLLFLCKLCKCCLFYNYSYISTYKLKIKKNL